MIMKQTILLLLGACLFAVHGVPDSLSPSKVTVGGKLCKNCLVDEYGRFRVFHGLNRVYKAFPWYSTSLLNTTHTKLLSEWGFNAVRLGTMWSGVEIGPYKLNSTYLGILDTILHNLADVGISALLDMHQDVLSSKFSSYDGAPRWLVDSFEPPLKPLRYPFPFSSKPASWGLNYLTWECGDAFDSLYQNSSGAISHLQFFWQTVAKRFGQYKSVLGYELINEPWPGNVIKRPDLFLPGFSGGHILQPLYDQLATAIAKVDDSSLIFYEPVTWGMIFSNSLLGSGFDHTPANLKQRAVLAFHFYCWFDGVDPIGPYSPWKRKLCDSAFYPKVHAAVSADIANIGGSMFLTEFGQCEASKTKNTTEYEECLSVLTQTDASFVSWTYWDSKFFDDSGAVLHDNVRLFSRTYAMAIAGQPITTSFSDNTGAYQLKYRAAILNVPTVIFVSHYHCSAGFNVSVTSGLKYSIVSNWYLEVTSETDGLESTVVISCK